MYLVAVEHVVGTLIGTDLSSLSGADVITPFEVTDKLNLSFDLVKEAYEHPIMKEMLLITFKDQVQQLESEDFVGLDLAQEDVPDAILNHPKVLYEPSFHVERGVIHKAFKEVGEVRLPFPKMTIITSPPLEAFNGKVTSLIPIYVVQDGDSVLSYFVTNRKGKVDAVGFRFYTNKTLGDNKLLTEIIATKDQVERLGGNDAIMYFAQYYLHIVVRVIYKMTMTDTDMFISKPTPEEARVNAKRIRKNKKPLVEFRMITIDNTKRIASAPKGTTHASPRQHWRRGHWRNTKTGKKVWIDPMLVGDEANGVIVKDYAIGNYEKKDELLSA